MVKQLSTFRSLFSLALPVFLLVTFTGIAQTSVSDHAIRLKGGTIYAKADARAWYNNARLRPAAEPMQVLLNFTTLPSSEDRYILEAAGIHLMDYIPDNTYTALVDFSAKTEVLFSLPVYSIIAAQPEWKADEYLWNKVARKKGPVEVLVSFCPGLDARSVKELIASMGGKINQGAMEQYRVYKVVIAAEKVRTLAQWYGVRYISPLTDIVPLDVQSKPAVKGNIASASLAHGGYGLTGDSVTVGVGDNASGIYHADINDRITNFNPAPNGHHGAHVNGIVGGAANVDPLAIGMATHVSLLDFLYDLIIPATGAMYQDHNMTITNNSYEVVAADCSYSGTYDIYAQIIDTQAIQYKKVLHVFASGNDGWMSCGPYPPGFATVGGGYQPAKNNVVVGSMTDFLIQAGDESRGPVKDGRLKPEIVATGLGAYSTVGVDEYAWAAGTSMASPQVAGGLALLTQHYKRLNGGAQPDAAELKAILLNGAMDLGNPGPDYSYGFGSMDLYRSLNILDKGYYSNATVSNGDSQTISITVPANSGHLKVMICWSDVPGSPVSSKQLVNDLDLTVKDPSNGLHLPLVLDPAPANVNNLAVEKADHLNNVEQVTIINPAAGTYAVTVKGGSIPFGPQRYYLVYDIMPKGLHLTFPIGGEHLANSKDPFDSTRVFWDAVTDSNKFTVQLSTNNGAAWTTISDTIAADLRRCDFIAAGISSGKCMVRLSRNNTSEVATSKRFVINTPPVAALDTAQCPGYVNIHWSPVLNATSYYLLKKVGNYMQVVDSVTTDTTYSFSGMPLHDKSYVAVQPVIDGLPGYRSLAVIRIADSGNCTKVVSSGDIMAERLVSRNSGRMFTSTAFSASSLVTVRLRDMYNAPCTNYTLSYKVNAGAWQTLVNPGAIPANGTVDINLVGVPIAPVGAYNITVAVHNTGLTDPQPRNDTIAFRITSLPNDTVGLTAPFNDGFESMPVFIAVRDSMGVSPDARWDFFNERDLGRMRSFVSGDISISGARSVSLDQNQNLNTGTKNTFVGTFNLKNYDTASTEIRLDFDYLLHGTPKTTDGNHVTIRAFDTMPWVPLYTYDLAKYPGFVEHVKSLSVTDAVRGSGRNFTTACQVSFGQNDTSLIATTNYGNGITFDNFRLYTVTNDVSLVSVVSPLPANCGLSASQPLTVRVHNGVNQTLHNIQMYYSMDGGTVFSGIIDSLTPKATLDFTFTQPVTIVSGITHTVNVWLSGPGDSYTANDTILNYHFRNSPIITAYPYLENFENGDGGYYSDGFRNSWQYGTPAAKQINKAASGTKAWKTNLTGKYNNLEKSYLYTPCFDLSSMANPTLSFSTAMDIENCGNTLCDAGYMEVSYDGNTWSKLGSTGQGTNWYDSTFNVWNRAGFTRWHVATISLPQPGPGVTTHFRFVMSSDPGAALEGMAIDDIHVYDLQYPIFPTGATTVITRDISGTDWVNQVVLNQLLSAVQPAGQVLNNTEITLYHHDTISNPGATQFTFPRSYQVKGPQQPADTFGIRLFLTEADMEVIVNDTTCPSCGHTPDAYSLGITQFENSNDRTKENNSLADDTGGKYTYHAYNAVAWVPYDKGYYAQFKSNGFSEYWFNDGGPTATFPAGIDYLNFIAYRNGSEVTTAWYSLIDTAVDTYIPEWSIDSINYGTFIDVPARHESAAFYSVNDPVNFTKYPVFYYRLKWTMAGRDGFRYSPVRRVDFGDSASTLITFDARMVNHKDVLLHWVSQLDGVVDHYMIERARGDGAFTPLDNVPSRHRFGEAYSFIDIPGLNISTGTLIHYRLTAFMKDGSKVVLPVRTVEWVNTNYAEVYPNPTHDGNLTINWFADTGVVAHLIISNSVGRTMYETEMISAQWNNVTTLQTFSGPKGVYFVRIDIDNRRYYMKIVYQ